MRLARRSLTVAAILAATSLAACDQPPKPNQPQVPNAGPADMNKLSEHGKVAASDIVRAPDGTLHALYLEEHSTHHRHQVYHRASTDGGKSWSTIRNLTEDEPERRAGMVKLAVDGQGQVYAFYWLHPQWASAAAGPNIGGDELAKGTLFYKLYDGGGWSEAVTVGRPDQTYGWFPSVDPTGQLHVVWVDDTSNEKYTNHAGRILQASVAGGAVGAGEVVYEAPKVPYSPGSEYYYQDSFQSLRGYVDRAGAPHWVAMRKPHDQVAEKREIVYATGDEPTVLFPASRFDGVYQFGWFPPQLYRDAAGQDHVLLMDAAAERPAVKDFLAPTGKLSALVSEVEGPKGKVVTFQATPGADGKVVAFVGQTDTGDREDQDMWLVRFDGKAWGAPTNLTQNEARAARQNRLVNDAVPTVTRFVPRFGAGVLGPDGSVNMVIVNDEMTTMRAGTASEAHAYFTKL